MNQSCPHDFCWVDDSLLSQVNVSSVSSVKALFVIALVQQFCCNQRSLVASVLGNSDGWYLNGILDDLYSSDFPFSQMSAALQQRVKTLGGIKQCGSSSWDNSFSNCCSGSTEGVSDSVLDLSDFDLAAASHFDDSDSPLELCESLFELLLVIAAFSVLDLLFDDLRTVLYFGPE